MICPATLGSWKCQRQIGHEHDHLYIDDNGVKSTWAPKQPVDVPVLPTPIAIDRSYLEEQARQQDAQVNADAKASAALDEGKGTAAENRAESTANFDQIPESIGEKEAARQAESGEEEDGNGGSPEEVGGIVGPETDAERMVRESNELIEKVKSL